MPNGIIIIDKPAGWTSMDVCRPTRPPAARGPLDQISSGEVNSLCGKVLPAGKTLVRRKSAESLAQRRLRHAERHHHY